MRYRALILRTGEHKGINITQESLENFVTTAKPKLPKNIELEYDTNIRILDSKLGTLESVELVGDKVYGEFEIPDWVIDVSDEKKPNVAISVNRKTCQLVSTSLVKKLYFEEKNV